MAKTKIHGEYLDPSVISGQTQVTAVGADSMLIFDATDNALKKALLSDLIETVGATPSFTSATISGDLTVDTSTLKVDSSNNRVGIGTTSPTHQFHIKGPTSAYAAMRIESTSTSHGSIINMGDSSDDDYGQIVQFASSAGEGGRMRFIAGATETMNLRGGNVGIGISSPDGTCHIHSGSAGTITAAASGNNLVVENSGAVGMSLLFDDAANNAYGNIYWGNETDGSADGRITYFGSTYVTAGDRQSMVFRTANTERMRIDSSGNLLVGHTSLNGTGGVDIGTSGYVRASRSGDEAAIFNRETNDGTIVSLQKDGTTVGSIGTEGTDLTIGSGGAALQFLESENRIRPWNMTTNGGSDNVMDLGRSSQRFNDLYLGGGVFLGGTGSANYLDDYEEGSWTPRISSSTGTVMSGSNCTYTKVGRLVTIRFDITNGSGSNTDIIYGLPFTSNGHGSVHWTWNNQGNTEYIGGYTNTGSIQLIRSGSTTSWSFLNAYRALGFGLYFTD